MDNIVKSTIEKIKNEHIAPESKWKYIAKKYFTWVIFGAIILLGSASFSAAYYLVSGLDWDLYRFAHQSFLGFAIPLIPYFWIFIIGAFLLAAFIDMRKTENGYRYGVGKIALVTIGSLIIFGIIFSLIGFGGRFNSVVAKSFPYYGNHMMMTKESQWMQPDKGFLAGTIDSVSSGNAALTDLNGKNWDVTIDENTLVRPAADVSKGEMIKVIGKKQGAGSFHANEIRPWSGMGMMNGQGGGNGYGGGMMNGQGMMRGGK